jgi:hypothetical protein
MYYAVCGNSPECPPDVEAHDVKPRERCQEGEQDAVPCNRKWQYTVLCVTGARITSNISET